MSEPTGRVYADRIVHQGHALVRAIEALDVIEPLTLIERVASQLLQAWYRRQYLVAAVPQWAGERILSASRICTWSNAQLCHNYSAASSAG